MQEDYQGNLDVLYTGFMKTGRPAKSPRTDFGARLHALRESAGLSQQQVADKMGISQPAYALWERRNVGLKTNQIAKLAKLLNVTLDELIIGDSGRSARGGPTGKARRLFEQLSKLPRSQQQHVLTVVEAFVQNKAQSIKS